VVGVAEGGEEAGRYLASGDEPRLRPVSRGPGGRVNDRVRPWRLLRETVKFPLPRRRQKSVRKMN
jgi:hypothetical protein